MGSNPIPRIKVFQMKVYLDNGATTRVDPQVVSAMSEFFLDEYGNPSSVHSLGSAAREVVESSRAKLAEMIGAAPDEIVFTSGGSESDNLALKGYARANRHKGNHIIVSAIEHKAVLKSCEALKQEGFDITLLPVDAEGFVSTAELESAITQRTILVSVMHANNVIGTIQDLASLGRVCKKHGVAFHSDTVQSFTKVPIDVEKMHVDMLSFSSHKIHGPKGVGALYVSKGVKLAKMIDGGPQEDGLRAGTENVPGIVGFVRAAGLVTSEEVSKMASLRDKLISRVLKEIPETQLNGPRKRLANNVNISFKGIDGESILMALDSEGISVSTGSACSSHDSKPNHVLLAIGVPPEDCRGSVRMTLSKWTTDEEINYTVEKLKEIVFRLRKISPLRG